MAAIDLLAKQASCHANNDITIQTFSVQYKFSKQTSQLKGLNQTVKQRKVKKIKTKKRKKMLQFILQLKSTIKCVVYENKILIYKCCHKRTTGNWQVVNAISSIDCLKIYYQTLNDDLVPANAAQRFI